MLMKIMIFSPTIVRKYYQFFCYYEQLQTQLGLPRYIKAIEIIYKSSNVIKKQYTV